MPMVEYKTDSVYVEKIKYDNRQNCKNKHSHKCTHVFVTVSARESHLNRNGQGFVFARAENKIRQKIIVPDPHCIKNRNGYCRWLENRKNNKKNVENFIVDFVVEDLELNENLKNLPFAFIFFLLKIYYLFILTHFLKYFKCG